MQDTPFAAALQRIMAVAEPEDVRVIVENANAAVAAMRERCAKIADRCGTMGESGAIAREIRALR